MQEPEEVRLVRALAENPAANVDYSRTFKGLEEQQLRRKDKHDAALHEYQQRLAAFSEQLEEEVLARSRDVREALARNDEQIEKLGAAMRDDQLLLTLEMDAVKALRTEAQDMIARRREIVADFRDKLEAIELNRSKTIEGMLKELARELATIAHRLRPDIEEIVESEAFELNTVMTANRKTYAELTIRMEKQVIDKLTMLESEWAVCMQQWRTLMHNRELERALAEYSSPGIVDPPSRNVYLQDLQVARSQLLDSRKQLMDKLAVMDMASIASDEVKMIAEEFEELNASELRQIRQWYEGLTSIRQQVEESMVSVREALRLQLHYFGALKPEPPLAEHAAQLQQFIEDERLADLYRKAGGLKPELSQLVRELRDPSIAYHAVLAAAQERAHRICAGFDLMEVLDKQGKSSMRDVLRSTNDKVRGTPKVDVLPLLPMLKKQIADLAEAQDIDEHCRELLLSCVQDVHTVIETAEDLRTADGEIRTSTGMTTGRSKAASTAGTSRASTRRSRKTAKPTLAETIAPEEDDRLKIDMVTLRTAQKQLGMILTVSELPDAIKDEVRSISSSLVQQAECNEVVNAAVSSNCDPVIKQTSQHQKQVVEALVLSLERHAEYWTAVTTRMCAFYSRLASIREEHAAKMKAIDDENHDTLAVLEFKYGEEVQRLEDLLAGCCKQISYATSDAQLQAEFERALGLLVQLEHFYHHYHSVACFAADIQPVATTKAAHQLLKSVCDAFHLVPPSEHAVLNDYRQTRSDAQRLNSAFLEATKSPMEAQAQGEPTVDGGAQPESQTELEPHASPDPEEYQALDPPVELMHSWLAVDSSVYAESTVLECWSGLQSSATFKVPAAAGSDQQTSVSYAVLVPFADATAKLLALARATTNEEAADEAQQPRTFAAFYSSLREETLTAYPEFETSGCMWWQPGFRLLSEEELQETQPSDVMASLASAFLILHESELQSLSIPEQRAYTAAKIFVRAIQDGDLSDEPSTAEQRLARHLRLPLKPDGAPLLPQIIPSAADMEEALCRAATSFLTFVHADSARNFEQTAALSKDRKQKLTELLEEMIRTHWPRRGEIETTIVQQREGELIAHYQRLARHQQLIQAKAATLEEKFQQLINDARVQCDNFVNALAAVRSKLAEQTTLAGVQGLELRGKKLFDEFMADCEARLATASTYQQEEPNRLKTTNHEVLRGCKAFDEGGNYSAQELEDIRNALQALDELIENAAQARQQRIMELREQQQQTAAGANDFWTQCKQVAQDLALSEGLGQKYGAPRRAAQEKMRTEVTRDESAAGNIDEWLAALEFECSEVEWCLRIYDDTNDYNTEAASTRRARQSAAPSAVLHKRVRNRLIHLRAAIQHRVKYLEVEAGNSPANAANERITWAEGAEDPPPIAHPFNSEPKPFAVAIEAAREECKTNTVQLYKAEGKADLIMQGGQTALPDALVRWLEEMTNKLLGREGYKDRASERLMGQLARLDRLWGREFMTKGITVQAVVFRDIYLSASTVFKSNAEDLEKQFGKSLKAWELGRQKHERVLRPHLSTPEGADELATLCEMEAVRSKELCQAIVAFRRDLFAGQLQLAQRFLLDVHNVATGLLQLLDSTVSAGAKQQLAPEGAEAAGTQRKSYKRLRKVQRLKQEALNARESSSASGSRSKSAGAATTTGKAGAATSQPQNVVPVAQLVAERKRTWPSLELGALVAAIQEADLACFGDDSTASGSVTAQSSFEQQYSAWMAELAQSSGLVSLVTPAHRTLFRERDLACSAFLHHVLVFSRTARAKYADLLQQERNWQERWTRQVDLLKSNEPM